MPLISFNLLQSLNIPDISIVFEVSNLDKFKYSKLLHDIAFIELTLLVSNSLNPFIFFNLLHSLNINSKLVAFEVLNPDKSKLCNSLHN